MDRSQLQNPDAMVQAFEDAADAMRASPLRRGSAVHLPAAGRLLVTGDLHDNPDNLARIRNIARLDASTDHHVVLHEMIHGERLVNGLDFSYRMLARAALLVCRHPAQVHPILANHELSQMTGIGVSKGAGNSVELFDDALDYIFGDRCQEVRDAINRFIAAMPLAVRSQAGVLCAHSLPAARSMPHFDPAVLEREMTEADYRGPRGAAYLMVWGRGYTDESTAELARHWDVSLFCVGHEHVDSGIETRFGRVVVLNSDHEQGRVLAIDLAQPPAPDEVVLYATPLSSLPVPGDDA